MRVFLTGATGFIGSHLARLLVREGCEVFALVRENSDPWRIKDIIQKLHLVRCNLLAFDKLDAHLQKIKPEMCIHLAWYAVPGKYLGAEDNMTLLAASLHLASSLREAGCRRFVGVGTCFEYDTSKGRLSETSPTRPESLYAASKLALQMVLQHFGETSGMEVTWPRLFYQYGPFEDERRLVPSIISSLLRNQEIKTTKGEQIRDYLHVEDVASAIWAIANSRLTGPVNIGSGRPVAVRDVVTRIGTILGHPELILLGAIPYSAKDPMFICADNRRLKNNTDWVPHYDLEKGLRNTIEWWRERLQSSEQGARGE
ncbi:MAG: NAD(P)-dependent oxidoreductase [Dehalococcoidia bacterium]|nr:MAG: NAD(P)-dependent oxidoreductase [Dehalococcoidia bacterium]